MDTGALTNAPAKISSVKPLRLTQWLICAKIAAVRRAVARPFRETGLQRKGG